MYYGILSGEEILREYFPNATEVHLTGGLNYGHLVKYKNFYLKVYDSQKQEAMCQIEGYRYHVRDPMFVDTIPLNRLRSYGKMVEDTFR